MSYYQFNLLQTERVYIYLTTFRKLAGSVYSCLAVEANTHLDNAAEKNVFLFNCVHMSLLKGLDNHNFTECSHYF